MSVDYSRLNAIPLFASLKEEDLAYINSILKLVPYPAGQVVVRQGDEGETFYIIDAGQVRVLRKDESGAEAVVRFLGFVPFDTLRCFYEAAAAFVFPSRYEGFGLPPLEAMACGTPVVTSSVSSLPEVVGDAAVLVNPENVFDIARGIREILLDQDLRAELVARGRRQAARFSWERTARAVHDIYREAARR